MISQNYSPSPLPGTSTFSVFFCFSQMMFVCPAWTIVYNWNHELHIFWFKIPCKDIVHTFYHLTSNIYYFQLSSSTVFILFQFFSRKSSTICFIHLLLKIFNVAVLMLLMLFLRPPTLLHQLGESWLHSGE